MSRLSVADVEHAGFKPLVKAETLALERMPVKHADVQAAGFKPLTKASTFTGSGCSFDSRVSFDFQFVAKKMKNRQLWSKDPWKKLTKTSSFVKDTPKLTNDLFSTAPPSSRTLRAECVVVVDPFSSGAILAQSAAARGFRVVRVLTEFNSPVVNMVTQGISLNFDATLVYNESCQAAHDPSEAADEMVRQLKELPWSVTAVIPGAETGVLLADQLATQLDVRNNGLKLSFARRNKYDMGETVRAAGVRAARQHCGHTWDDIESFLEDLKPSPFLCVAKPIQSAGSDDVIKCTSVAEVKGAFDKINGAVNGLGVINEGILVQEYLEGAEYVVDSVSRDGVHKVTAIWEYDKRSVNGANFVYFGMTLLPATGPLAEALAAYSDEVLDALEIHNGPGHMEVKMCNGGPCLVEVGSRCHGGEGSWRAVALECVGYDQIECTLDAYLDSKAFEQLPKKPAVLQAHGCEVFLVARQSGVVRSLPGKVLCANLASYRGAEWQAKPGSFSSATIDCFTRPGAVQLAHVDAEQLKADVATIRDHESKGHLLDFEVVCATAPPAGCVVVVDPFSTGALMAASVMRRGLKLAIVWSDAGTRAEVDTMQHMQRDDDPGIIESRAPQEGYGTHHCSALETPVIIHNAGSATSVAAAVSATAAAIKAIGDIILAVVPGAESGVLLADQLSVQMGTRSNPLELSHARRNKFDMGETVREAGVRAVRQYCGHTWDEVMSFLEEWKPSPFLCVVKPIQSAGSDDVIKCTSPAEVNEAFHKINGAVNRLGVVNEGVLVQEYLDGAEYVVDSVSRDGVHKITAIWEYDKRAANGHFNVYFGTYLRAASDELVIPLVGYAKQVLDALGIFNGPGHMEVKMCKDGPCLVEVGSRCHGAEGTWVPLVMECLGYNQVEAALDVYVNPAAFDMLPMVPLRLACFGAEIDLVSFRAGVVTRLPGLDIIRAMPSFRSMELAVQPGSYIEATVDCFTRPGCVTLADVNEEVLLADCEAIRALEREKLFVYADD